MQENIEKLYKITGKDPDLDYVASFCPGRISFSKHSDYINNDLLYIADSRGTYILSESKKNSKGKLELLNHDEKFQNKSFDLKNLNLKEKESWDFYIRKLLILLSERYELNFSDYDLKIAVSSTIPKASGLSSSHSLILSTLINLIKVFKLEIKEAVTLIKICQEVEQARGFQSGLGDQAAQLLSKEGKILNLKLSPILEYNYTDIPDELSIITAPSFIKADKSLPEFKAANENIKIYKELNKKIAEKENLHFLGNLLYKYSDKEILNLLKREEAHLTRKEIGLALYGLSEGARAKELKENFTIQKLGQYLNRSHLAEQNYEYSQNGWQRFNEEGNFELNLEKPLIDHIGIYSASTLANDQLQYYANQLDIVYGSSISGAGLGGNNIIVCKKGYEEKLIEHLIEKFYKPIGLSSKARNENFGIHIVKSSDGAKLL